MSNNTTIKPKVDQKSLDTYLKILGVHKEVEKKVETKVEEVKPVEEVKEPEVMEPEVAETESEPEPVEPEVQEEDNSPKSVSDLKAMLKDELKTLAISLGLDDSGTKTNIIDRIAEALNIG